MGLGDPLADYGGVSPGVQCGPVLGELPGVLVDLLAEADQVGRDGVVLASGKVFDRGGQVRRVECLAEPGVQFGEDLCLAQVDGAGVVDVVGARVLVGEGAPVVGLAVVPASLHAPVADSAEQQSAQHVGTRARAGTADHLAGVLGCEELLCLPEDLITDDRRVDDLLGEDPFVFVVPAHLGRVAERDVVHVEQHFVLALPVPDLASGVAGVGQDGADGTLGPRQAAAVTVAAWVVGGRARDAVAGQPLGNRIDPIAGEKLREDALDHDCDVLVYGQDVQALAVSGLGRVGVRPGVDELVSVGRPATEVTAFDLGLSGHGGTDPDLDAVALSFGDTAEHAHDQVMGLVGRIDRPADLGHPQRHAVVLEQRVGIAELVAVERPLRLPHHDRLKAPVRVG